VNDSRFFSPSSLSLVSSSSSEALEKGRGLFMKSSFVLFFQLKMFYFDSSAFIINFNGTKIKKKGKGCEGSHFG